MKIADLDLETRKVIVMAHVYLKFRNDENLARLTSAIKEFDEKHCKERTDNLLRALEECDTNDPLECEHDFTDLGHVHRDLSIEELEKILHEDEERKIEIKPDGTIRELRPATPTQETK